MRIYIEALILYIVLFFSGFAGIILNTTADQGFSVQAELIKTFLYSIPSIAIIWYLLSRVKPIKNWNIKPGKNDLVSGFITYPCLLITGFTVSLIYSYINKSETAAVLLYSPVTAAGWVVLVFSCICAAYLEETFFRFYLLSRREELKLKTAAAVTLSVLLFSICHIYSGPWGVLNSFLSALILSIIFLRYKSIHGIAIAHGLYNITAFVLIAITGN